MAPWSNGIWSKQKTYGNNIRKMSAHQARCNINTKRCTGFLHLLLRAVFSFFFWLRRFFASLFPITLNFGHTVKNYTYHNQSAFIGPLHSMPALRLYGLQPHFWLSQWEPSNIKTHWVGFLWFFLSVFVISFKSSSKCLSCILVIIHLRVVFVHARVPPSLSWQSAAKTSLRCRDKNHQQSHLIH